MAIKFRGDLTTTHNNTALGFVQTGRRRSNQVRLELFSALGEGSCILLAAHDGTHLNHESVDMLPVNIERCFLRDYDYFRCNPMKSE